MDFFEHQAHAKRLSRRLIVLFVLAVVAVVVSLNFLSAFIWSFDKGGAGIVKLTDAPAVLFYWITGITLAVITVASLWQISQLSQGGVAVAEMLGARWLRRDSRDPAETRLLNVIDEMAIASGIVAPRAYVMDGEDGINAFAAGYSPNQAVIAVSRGALKHLSRDELQGVVAHEFSHVLNGDMQLNIRMMGLLHGILAISLIGRILMRVRGKNSGQVVLAGLAMFIIGYIGIFFGNLIKSAVSRQREFLADASAVQFTRNPDGIGSALARIGKHPQGTAIGNAHAEELSHMFFGQALASQWYDWFATHPPLEDRVKRLYGGRVPSHLPLKRALLAEEPQAPGEQQRGISPSGAKTEGAGAEGGMAATQGFALAVTSGMVLASIGSPSANHLAYAQDLLSRLPEVVRTALHTSEAATALLYALLLGLHDTTPPALLEILHTAEQDARIAARAEALSSTVAQLERKTYLPLVEMALPILSSLPLPEREAFLGVCRRLIEADRKVSLDEFVFYTLLESHLGARAGKPPERTLNSLEALSVDVGQLLALLAHAGYKVEPEAMAAYSAGQKQLYMQLADLMPRAKLSQNGVSKALQELKCLNPKLKARLVKAMLAVVLHDRQVQDAEMDLMRAACAALDVPLPPVLSSV